MSALLNYFLLTILQDAAHTVRLDGDIICQQNEISPWQANDGSGSNEELRSVCSCTAVGCDPFHLRQKRRLKERRNTLDTENETLGDGIGLNETRCSTRMKWYSTDSLHTSHRSPLKQSCDHLKIEPVKARVAGVHAVPRSEKAGSLHDLRRHGVSSLLRVPPQYTNFTETRPRLPLQFQVEKKSQVVTVTNEHHQNHHNVMNTSRAKNPVRKLLKWARRVKNGSSIDAECNEEGLPLEEMDRVKSRHQKRASL